MMGKTYYLSVNSNFKHGSKCDIENIKIIAEANRLDIKFYEKNLSEYSNLGIYISKTYFPQLVIKNNDDDEFKNKYEKFKHELYQMGINISEIKASIDIDIIEKNMCEKYNNNSSNIKLLVKYGTGFQNIIHTLLQKIEIKDCILILTDPYLGCKENLNEKYTIDFVNIINKLTPKKVVYLGKSIVAIQNIHNLEHIVTDKNHKVHDRYYINCDKNKGFFTGTSINGIANNICLADMICDEDVKVIKEYLVGKFNIKF